MKLFTTTTPPNASIGKLATIGCTFLIVSALVIIIDPMQIIVDSQLTLKAGTLLFNFWLKPPLDVFISVYLFNVTNLDAFVHGVDSKLKVTEVGPYVYQEFLENQNVTFNANNTMTFVPVRTVKFVRERSVGDPKVDRIFAPNIPYMGATSAAAGFSAFAAIAVNALTKKLNSKAILEMSVEEYLWGYDDQLIHLASKLMPNVINFERFGLMERMINEGYNLVTMKLPEKAHKNAKVDSLSLNADYSIDNWNGEHGLKNWDYRENQTNTYCNTLTGSYDGTLFPRPTNKSETYRIYRKAFCRTLAIEYSHPSTYHGIETYNFKLKSNAFDSDLSDPESACFCKSKKCLKRGLGNITPCYYNIPLAVSFPHFFNGDPSLLAPFDGLSPNEQKHGTEVMIQPQLGLPIQVHTRFQLNLLIGDIKFDPEMSRFRNMALPIFWVEVRADDLTPQLTLLLKLLFKICPYTQLGLVIAFMVIGVSLMGTALLFCFWIPTPWHALKSNENDMAKSKMQNISILPLLTQPAERLTKRQMNKVKQEDDVMLLPLQSGIKKDFVV